MNNKFIPSTVIRLYKIRNKNITCGDVFCSKHWVLSLIRSRMRSLMMNEYLTLIGELETKTHWHHSNCVGSKIVLSHRNFRFNCCSALLNYYQLLTQHHC